MNERIRELAEQAGFKLIHENCYDIVSTMSVQEFAQLIVRECIEQIHLECEDFENGNCFADDELWRSVTREYGKNKERGFDPVGMSIHFDKMLKKHFGVEE